MSQITTHILDTSRGIPAKMVTVVLFEKVGEEWIEVSMGITNNDGRISNLIREGDILPFGIYKLKFETKAYFKALGIRAFYPMVEIIFEISSAEHYHVPLLLNPYGYSTYRGS